MAPDIGLNFRIKDEKTQEFDLEEVINKGVNTNEKFYHQLVIPNLIFFILLHVGAVIGAYYFLFHAKILTILWAIAIGFLSGEAVALGAHRYWAHKSYKMTPSLKAAMVFFQTMAGQNSMFTWTRDHRLHHKYSDTDADPHNSNRGFIFAHIGWMVSKKHPLVTDKTKCIDMSDILEDKLVMFQHKYFVPVYLLVGFLIPTYFPVLAWNEDWWTSFFVTYCFRYMIILHLTWCVNSFAHKFGTKPYDGRLVAMDSTLVANLTGGDGWHNYHHTFPWDASAGEFSVRGGFNTKILHRLADYGYVYDIKSATDAVIEGHTKRHGDGTRPIIGVVQRKEGDTKKQENGIANGLEEKLQKTN